MSSHSPPPISHSMIEVIKRKAREKMLLADEVIVTNSDVGAHSGHIILKDGFRIGFILFDPDNLSLTMSKKEIEEQHNIYIKKYAINKNKS